MNTLVDKTGLRGRRWPFFDGANHSLRQAWRWAGVVVVSCVWSVAGYSALSDATGLAPSGAEPLQPDLLAPYDANADLAEALRLVEQGQLDSALPKIEAFLRQHPDSAPGEEILGVILALQGKVDEGLVHLQRAIQINPNQSTAITKVGDVYLARGETAKAKSQFQEAIAVNPGDRFAQQRLGIIFEREGDLPRAIEHFEKGLVGTAPNYLGIKVDLGRLYNQTRRFQKTIDLLSSVVTENCRDVTAQLVLGTAWMGLHKPNHALLYFERARKLESQPEAAHLALGIAYREAGDLPKSQAELAAALEGKPGWPTAQFQMGETLVAMERISEAMPFYARAAQGDGNRTWVQNRMAEVYASHKQEAEALKVYQSLRADGVADMRSYDGLATLLQVTGRFPEAEEVLQEACRKFPGSAEAQFRLGMHLALVRNYDRAIDVLHGAQRLAPADPRIQKAVSLTELRRGNRDLAISEARRLLQLVPDSVEDQFYLATLLEDNGQLPEAARLYETVLRQAPEHVGALNNLAQVRLKDNQPQAALALAQKAIGLAPDNAFVLDTLGWAQYQCGDLHAAVLTLEKNIAQGAATPNRRYHLAVVYSRLGQKGSALEQLDLALKQEGVFPDREDAVRLADQLRQPAPR